MCAQPAFPKVPPVIWDFTITKQGLSARYGHLGNDVYKQFLPGGLVDDLRFPPKRIDKRTYLLADKEFTAAKLQASQPGG